MNNTDNARAETTTATVEHVVQEVARLIDSCIPDRKDAYGFRHAMKAAVAMSERGLLATDRPQTTTEIAARALEQAANDGADVPGPDSWLKFKSGWGSNDADVQTIDFALWVGRWLRARAARLRAGEQ